MFRMDLQISTTWISTNIDPENPWESAMFNNFYHEVVFESPGIQDASAGSPRLVAHTGQLPNQAKQ